MLNFTKVKYALGTLFLSLVSLCASAQTHWARPYVASVVNPEGDYSFYFVNYEDIHTNIFYNNDIYGQNTSIANVEGGLPWLEHSAFTGTNIGGTFIGTDALGKVQEHATSVSSIMVSAEGFNETEIGANFPITLGIAHKATFYAGDIATSYGENGTFATSDKSIYTTYYNFFITNPVDVINSSWGGDETVEKDELTPLLDAFANMSSKTTFVVAAGNSGPNPNSVGMPARNLNGITVGAWDNISNTSIADFSSRAPSDFKNPITGEVVKNVIASVDIATSGVYISGALYDPEAPEEKDYYNFPSGTSVAAPIVSGTVSLLKSTAKQLGTDGIWDEQTVSNALDTRVVKAVLMNSALKNAGWDNAQTIQNDVKIKTFLGGGSYFEQTFDNVSVTSQGLDYSTGAGLLDAERAFVSYVNEQWIFDEIYLGESRQIQLTKPVSAGYIVDATLVWFENSKAETVFDEDGAIDTKQSTVLQNGLANLDLELWLLDESGNNPRAIALSNSGYNTTEHIHLILSEGGTLILGITFGEMVYGSLENNAEKFALAWSVAVPEPAHTIALIALFALLVVRFRRR